MDRTAQSWTNQKTFKWLTSGTCNSRRDPEIVVLGATETTLSQVENQPSCRLSILPTKMVGMRSIQTPDFCWILKYFHTQRKTYWGGLQSKHEIHFCFTCTLTSREVVSHNIFHACAFWLNCSLEVGYGIDPEYPKITVSDQAFGLGHWLPRFPFNWDG